MNDFNIYENFDTYCICFKPVNISLKGNVIIFSRKKRTENYESTFFSNYKPYSQFAILVLP